MAVDLIGYAKIDDRIAIQEAATAGIRGIENLVFQLSQQNSQIDCREITDHTVSKFKKMISILNRTGHARFRRGPSPPEESPARSQSVTLDFTKTEIAGEKSNFHVSTPISSTKSSFLSSITRDGSVTKGTNGLAMFPPPLPPPTNAAATFGKLPLSSSFKKKCHSHGDLIAGSCHCLKKRKSRVKRTIRLPAISSKIADIPSDEFSWRKYGQKPIKGSPYPRGYYKCSSMRGCPARKHVERAVDEPSMLIITYEGDHQH